MKQLLICAALVGLTTSAQAQGGGFSFDINGQHVRIGVPKHCDNDERCVSITTGKPGEQRNEQQIDGAKLRDMFQGFMNKGQNDDGEDDPAPKKPSRSKPSTSATAEPESPAPAPRAPAPAPVAKVPAVEQPAPAVVPPTQNATAPAPTAPVVAEPSHPLPAPGSLKPGAAPSATALATPEPNAVVAPPTAAVPAPVPVQPAPPPTPAPSAVAIAPPQAPVQAPVVVAPAPEQTADSPAGMWVTQNKEGRVHIMPCGENFCGYVVDPHSAHNGAKVLIDMRQTKDRHWAGQVHDPKGGGTYDATMSLKNADTLAVRGCAMGGLICRGQTWVRG